MVPFFDLFVIYNALIKLGVHHVEPWTTYMTFEQAFKKLGEYNIEFHHLHT